MTYLHTSWLQLQQQLSLRLADVGNVFWTVPEIQIWLTESLRTFGVCSGFWRDRGSLQTVANTAFYDLPTLLTNNNSELILSSSVTDRAIIQQLQYALLENAASQMLPWAGTEMFTYNDMANSVQARLNQFLADTGITVNRSLIAIAPPPGGRVVLDQKTVDVRRAAWLGAAPESYYTTLWREDERLLTAADQTWSVDPGQPQNYSIMAPPPLQVQLSPIPSSSGQLELLTVDSIALNPAASATILGIPDDLTPAIKWGALADLLGNDGLARDPIRATFAESRYRQYVMMARMLPVVIHAELNGIPLIPSTLEEMDASTPNWQNIIGSPAYPIENVLLAAPNLIAIAAIPDAAYAVNLDVVRRTPTYANPADPVQIGREQLDAVLDYAESLALFKVGGAEWHATERQANNLLIQAVTYNQRLSAAARAAFSASMQSQRQKESIPRRMESGIGVGSVKGVPSGS